MTLSCRHYLAGIKIRTENTPGKADKEIPLLWNTVMKEGLLDQIEHPLSEVLYGLYYDYEGDETKPYSLLVGKEVQAGVKLPKSFEKVTIPEQKYIVFPCTIESIFETWQLIWKSKLKRTFTYDFEKYLSLQNIEIHISIA